MQLRPLICGFILGSSPLVALDYQQAYEELYQALQEQRDCLKAITSEASAKAQIEPYQKLAAQLKDMRGRIADEQAFYASIQNNKRQLKALTDLLQEIMVEITRLKKQNFYGVATWAKLLSLPEDSHLS